MAAPLSTLTPLIATLKADGYTVIGPARRDDAIVLPRPAAEGEKHRAAVAAAAERMGRQMPAR